MNKFIKTLIKIKINACIIITASIFFMLIFYYLTGQKSIQMDTILQLLIISFLGSVIQWFAFSDDIIKKHKYVYRNIVFLIPFFTILSVSAFIWHWFDFSQISQLIVFLGIFILAYIGISIGFSIYFKETGQKYNEKLEEYKANK